MGETMQDPVTNRWHQKGPAPIAGRRPRGSVLVLVMAILGVLFVTGVTFLMTMNFEARLLRAEEQTTGGEASVDFVDEITGDWLGASLIDVPGITGGASSTATYEWNATLAAYEVRPQSPAWAELPGIHGLISQVEPTHHVDGAGNDVFRFDYTTNVDTISTGVFDLAGVLADQVDTSETVGLFNPDPHVPPAPVDADGDGIVDSRQYELSLFEFPSSQVELLAKALNPSTNPEGPLYLGLRIVPHGAMVDLDDAHPLMILSQPAALAGVCDPQRGSVDPWTPGRRPYSPILEEPSLRWRNFLPPPRDTAQRNPGQRRPRQGTRRRGLRRFRNADVPLGPRGESLLPRGPVRVDRLPSLLAV